MEVNTMTKANEQRSSQEPPRIAIPENDMQNFMGQENWRQRIRKENLHAPRHAQFSVRSAVRALDVTKKPTQVHPSSCEPSANTARSYARNYIPREQLLWPETSQHEMGWLVQDVKGIPFAERNTILAPSQLGFGWRRRSAERRQECCESVLPRQPTPSTASSSGSGCSRMRSLEGPSNQAAVPSKMPVPWPSSAEQALPWFPGIGKLRRQRRLWRMQQREIRSGEDRQGEQLGVQEREEEQVEQRSQSSRPQSALPGNSAGFRTVVYNSANDKWLGPGDTPVLKPSSADHNVITSRSQKCREFLRNGPRSHWERHKPVSDMSSFAHGYTMLWGVNFFSSKGSQRH
ncbi:unnamed protein product [Durusdinium trenchii]|uniref:Uncharacterized protein n=1 Tax=Durusdinium trenchii TaxID=1381693 RepID=A0ABP0MIQ7_9DINO